MRILQVAPGYYPRIGGVEYVVKSVSERLVKIGHEVAVLAGEPGVESQREEDVNGVRVIRWPTWSPGGAYHFPRKRSLFGKRLSELLGDVDVLHAHNIHSIIAVEALKAARERGVRVVFTPYYHGTGHTAVRRFLWFFWRGYTRRIVGGSIVHTVSRLEAQLVERDLGVEAITIENGVEEWVRSLEWSPRDYVLYSGRIEEYKNIHLLAGVVRALNEKYGLDLELKVFGEGPYKSRLERILRDMGVRYELGGFKPFEEYIETLSHAVFLGLLSSKESYPQSVNEANAIGVPVVVAKPWGTNFEGRKRTLIVDLSQGVEAIARSVHEFLKRAPHEEKSLVPTWSEVALEYLKKLYGG